MNVTDERNDANLRAERKKKVEKRKREERGESRAEQSRASGEKQVRMRAECYMTAMRAPRWPRPE